MKIVTRQQQVVTGISVRTSNAAEIDTDTQKIAPMWQRFMELYGDQVANNQRVYGVYYDYESDMDGQYSVMAAVEKGRLTTPISAEPFSTQVLASGNYLCFSAEGEMPQAVVSLWNTIWAYFAKEDCPYQRQYVTDFECYTSGSNVDIYIGVHVEV